MSVSNLIRLCGLAVMLEGLLFVIAELPGLSRLGYASLSESFASGVFPVEALLTMLGAILGLLGLVGLYASQSEATSLLGLVGLVASFIDLALVAGTAWVNVFILTSLARTVRALIDEATTGVGGFILSYLIAGVEGVLFGVATFRGRIYPRPGALLFTVGAVLAVVCGILGGEWTPRASWRMSHYGSSAISTSAIRQLVVGSHPGNSMPAALRIRLRPPPF